MRPLVRLLVRGGQKDVGQKEVGLVGWEWRWKEPSLGE